MAKLYLLAIFAVLCAVFVSARNTYQSKDEDIDEEIYNLLKSRVQPVNDDKRTSGSEEPEETDQDFCEAICGDDEDCLSKCFEDLEDSDPIAREVGGELENGTEQAEQPAERRGVPQKKFFRVRRLIKWWLRRYRGKK